MERLSMNQIRDIVYRKQQGQSERQIARDLGISRVTVRKYRQVAEAGGYLASREQVPSGAELAEQLGPAPRPPQNVSTVEPYRAVVERLLGDGVEMRAILARLEEHGYRGSYSSVQRFVRHLRPPTVTPVVRVETGPGEEAQVDFGTLGRLVDARTGELRTAYAFVLTLGFSRHQYAEIVFDQKVGTWIGCHLRAFAAFEGAPKRLVPDNLKAAVLVAALHDPVLGEPYRRLAQHHGCLISPTRPRTPQHKGKVESGVHYLKRNFWAGQEFADSVEANERLAEWVTETAGTRRHGTTGRAPLALFGEREQAALLPLPAYPFTLEEVRRVKVHSDCHAVIDGSFYSAPWTTIGQTLEAHLGERVVELYRGVELITTHLRATEPGTRRTRPEHYPPEKAAYLERTPDRCRALAERVGPATLEAVQTLLADRPLDRLRSVQALLRLEESVGPERLEAACRRALHFGDPRYRRIKDILTAALDHEPLPEEVAAPPPAPARTFAFARVVGDFFGEVTRCLAPASR